MNLFWIKYIVLFLAGVVLAGLFQFKKEDRVISRHCAYTNERYEMPSEYTGHCVCIYDEGYVMLERCEKE